MIFFELYNIALTLSVITGAAIAAWLWFRARGQEGMQPLAYFSAGVSLWCGAILAIQHGTPTIVNLALWLLPLGVLNPAFFLHFASRFVYNEHKMFVQAALYPLYGLSAVLIVFGFWFKMATPMTWLTHFQVFTLTPHGWVVSGFATLISTLGYIVLFHGWLKGNVKKRRQVLAVLFSGGLGFFCTIAFLWPSLNINLTPYPLLILPFYNLLLVYGIQRYEIMKLNRWANRAMVWLASMLLVLLTVTLLLVFLAQLGFNEIADVPLGQMWVLSLTLILLFLFMQKPVVSLIDQLVYPGLKVNTGTLNSWRLALDKTNSVESMQAQAKAMLKATLRQDIDVIIHQGDNSPPIYRAPALVLQQDNQQWVCHSKGWKGATPSEQRLGDLFSNVLLSSVMQLDKNLELIKQQQDQIEQQHLAEMGLLSAAVAHDLRNPLNIISMAATQCNESTRQDIKTQLARADHLIKDLLNYTGELVITAQQVGMLAFIQPIIKATLSDSTHITCDISPEFSMNIDPFRLQQVLTNLLSNAENALQNHPDGKIHITAHTTTEHQLLHISDNGSGIPDAFQDSIFKPFATRRTGGIGLGLAISKRIIDAHQGSIRLIPQSINELRTLISRIAPAPISVLITGPSGTGKELVARALHQLSTRKPQQFVSVHGAAISSELIESELFGHVKGAFTG
ncbi:MAG: sigma 54-interacting transcriptional regulator, partial [Methylococcales bacterium]|nr:sigma 54-interacting transcriptional regulator [Methylococcales bacterium]